MTPTLIMYQSSLENAYYTSATNKLEDRIVVNIDLARLRTSGLNAREELLRQRSAAAKSFVVFLNSFASAKSAVQIDGLEALLDPFVDYVNARTRPNQGVGIEELYYISEAIRLWHVLFGWQKLARPARDLSRGLAPFLKNSDAPALTRIFDNLFFTLWKTCSDHLEGSLYVRDHLILPFSDFLKRTAHSASFKKPVGTPIKIAFLMSGMSMAPAFAPGRLYASWWIGLDQESLERVEVSIYSLNAVDDEVKRLFNSFRAIKVRYFNDLELSSQITSPYQSKSFLLDQLRSACQQDEIDVIVFNGVRSDVLQVIHQRIARFQLFSPMSFVPLISSGVDGFFLTDNAVRDAVEMGVPQLQTVCVPFSAAEFYLTPKRPQMMITKAREALPKGRIIFGSFARDQKISPEFASVVAEILRRVPDGVFFTAGNGPTPIRREIFMRAGCDMERVTVYPIVDAHVFGHLIDVYLDTFPIAQGLAAIEVMAKGIPVIHLKSPALNAIWETQRDGRAVAEDGNAYVDLAVSLAGDVAMRAEYGAAGRKIASSIMDTTTNAAVLIDNINTFVQRSIHGHSQ